MQTWEPTVPAHWQRLAQEDDRDAVIVFPLHGSQLASQYQHIHGRALWGGMVEDQPWAHPKAWVDYGQQSPLMQSLRALSYGRDTEVDRQIEDTARLEKAGFGWLVFDSRSWTQSRWSGSIDPLPRLRSEFGEPFFESDSGAIWRLGQHASH